MCCCLILARKPVNSWLFFKFFFFCLNNFKFLKKVIFLDEPLVMYHLDFVDYNGSAIK